MSEIQILNLDTRLFGFKVGMLTEKTLTEEEVKGIVRECKDNGIKCLYADLDISDFTTLSVAVKHGFIISDIRVTFEKDISAYKNDKMVTVEGCQVDDKVKPCDITYLEKLSRELSKVSRFAFDQKFPRGSAGDMYTLWVRNSIKKRAVKIFIARETESQEPIGFLTCKEQAGQGEIVLIGVSKKHSREGVASLLLNRACSYFMRKGLKKVKVKTQGCNISALRLYQKVGFVISNISVFFHLWIE